MNEKILIVGAGVAGLYLKNRLESLGYRPHLVEKDGTIRTDGAGILLGPNVLKLFRASGHEASILARSTTIKRLNLLTNTGESLGYNDLALVKNKTGYDAVAIHRKALHEILHASVDTSTIRLSRPVVGISQTSDGVEVSFQNGDVEHYDYVIGADGIHSAVRKALFGDDGLRDAKQSCWRVVSDVSTGLDVHDACEMWGVGKRLGIFPIGENKVYTYMLANAEPRHASMSLEEVMEYFREFEGDWTKVSKGVGSDTELLFNPLADIAKIRLASGRVALIGDAGHSTTPNLGQGAAIGLESAFELSELIGAYGLSEAIKRYPSKRFSRVNYIRERSWMIGKMAHYTSPIARWIRDFVMKITPQLLSQKEYERSYWYR